MKRLLLLLLAFACVLTCLSCSDKTCLDNCFNDYDDAIIGSRGSRLKLPDGVSDLSSSDAMVVARIYDKKSLDTKSSYRTIKSVIPIHGDDGEIAIYAVNFNDGYVLVSATTKYYPIIAEVEHGSYSPNPDSGFQEVLDEHINAVKLAKQDELTIETQSCWGPYFANTIPETYPTKVDIDYEMLLDSYLSEWGQDDRNVYHLRDQPENMPDELYERFCYMAYMDMPEASGYPYLDCAIITEKFSSNTNQRGPYLATKWDQSGNGDGTGISFNSELPNSYHMGCVTIATGQIMRYFQRPSNVSWSNMPNYTSNTTLSQFLADLRDELRVNAAGEATINDAKRVLTSYGYSCSIINHQATQVYSALTSGMPVYMRGVNTTPQVGHAWVCDGFQYFVPITEYCLYILRFDYNNNPVEFIEWDHETIRGNYPIYFHMNWGWSGSHDGYFIDSNIQIHRTDGNRNYANNRKDIIISAIPNN